MKGRLAGTRFPSRWGLEAELAWLGLAVTELAVNQWVGRSNRECSVGLTTECWRLSAFTVHELANAAGSSTGLPSDVTKSSVRTAKPARYTNQRRSFVSKKLGRLSFASLQGRSIEYQLRLG